ncbi:MAG: extracellular solute-binding protein [Halolamina sp.]
MNLSERAGAGPTTDRRGYLRAVGGVGAVGLAGCGGRGEERRGTVTGTDGTTVLELVDVAGSRSKDHYQRVVDELNASSGPTVELEFTEIPYNSMRQQLLTQAGGGDPPDIAAIDQIWLGEFIDAGALLSLDGVAADIDFDDYLDALAAPVQDDGSVYGFPISTDVRGMYWNKAQFEAAGLDPESPPTTWDELVRVAGELHDPPETFGAAYLVKGGRWIVDLFGAGGDVLDTDYETPRFQKQPGVDAATYLDRLHNEATVTPPEPLYENAARVAREFLEGTYAINVVEGSWLDYYWRNLGNSTASMPEQFGFASTPTRSGEPMTMSGGFTWAGFQGTDNPKLVRSFLRIAAGRPFQRELAIETGDIPTRESLLEVPDIWDTILYSDTVKSLLQRSRTRPVRNWTAVAKSLNPALQRVAFDQAEPAAALDKAAEQVRDRLG